MPLVDGPTLSLLGLIFPPVRQAEQVIHVVFDGHQLPHLPLGLPASSKIHVEMLAFRAAHSYKNRIDRINS